ncbi:MAG: hypothetical protein LUG50_04465 [Planctomycetaceae bacterium]|nr:hypothetical protein [Planctomycetaceae bacterium]
MHHPYGRIGGSLLVCFLLLSAIVTGPAGEEAGRRNPALPSDDDLILFDDSAPDLPIHVDVMGANQAAFPVLYGEVEATVARATDAAPDHPAAPADSGSTTSASGQPTGVTITVTTSPVVPGSAAEPSFPAGVADAAPTPVIPTETAIVAPAGAAPSDTVAPPAAVASAPGEPVPLPPPVELTGPGPATAARSTPAGAVDSGVVPTIAPVVTAPTVGLAELGTGGSPDGTPIPPPPLPELPATTPEPPLPPPDLALVRAEFNRLKTFCEEDSLGSAAEVYARLPEFGKDEEVNHLRADAANLLILALARADNLSAAKRIYESVPLDPPGYDASLAKARAVINLTTYYVRAERFNDAFAILMDVGSIPNRSALNNELFRLMARMIPYLDNAEETDKAQTVFDLLLAEVKSPGTAALFSDNVAGVLKYLFYYVDKTESPPRRRIRLDFLEYIFAELERYAENQDIRLIRKQLGDGLAERYSGVPERAARFYTETGQ